MHLDHAAISFVGRRSNNEDSYCSEPELGLFAVADGVGGYEGGEVASNLVVTHLSTFFRENAADPNRTWPYKLDASRTFPENLLGTAVRLAHREIVIRRVGTLSSMASTVASIYLAEGVAVIGHCGDSRVYRWREGQVEQLTTDHSLYEQMKAKGVTDLPPLDQCPFKNVVTRVLGLDDAHADLRSEPVQPGDAFLLCSDGLYDPVGSELLAEALGSLDAQAACRGLVDEAYARGSKDNITGIVVKVLE